HRCHSNELGFGQAVQARSDDPNDPLIIFDPWLNTVTTTLTHRYCLLETPGATTKGRELMMRRLLGLVTVFHDGCLRQGFGFSSRLRARRENRRTDRGSSAGCPVRPRRG